MISINVTMTDDRAMLKMDGHANYNPGNDIVCAGCSAILYGLVNWLENSKDKLHGNPYIRMDSGTATISAKGGPELHEAFKQALFGFMSISSSYPENVSVKVG